MIRRLRLAWAVLTATHDQLGAVQDVVAPPYSERTMRFVTLLMLAPTSSIEDRIHDEMPTDVHEELYS